MSSWIPICNQSCEKVLSLWILSVILLSNEAYVPILFSLFIIFSIHNDLNTRCLCSRLLSKFNWKIPWLDRCMKKGCGCVIPGCRLGGVRRARGWLAGMRGEGCECFCNVWRGPGQEARGARRINTARPLPAPCRPTNLRRPYVFRRQCLFFYSSH